jgi:hypothetical protein
LLKQNQAQVDSLKKVQDSQSIAYSNLKTKLGMTNDQLMSFIKNKLIHKYEGKDLVLNVQSPEKNA